MALDRLIFRLANWQTATLRILRRLAFWLRPPPGFVAIWPVGNFHRLPKRSSKNMSSFRWQNPECLGNLPFQLEEN
jgi:hypothetical protein